MIFRRQDATKKKEIQYAISDAFMKSNLDLQKFLSDSVKAVVYKFPVECAEIRLIDDRNPELLICKESIHVRNRLAEETTGALGATVYNVGDTLIGKTYKDGKPFIFDEKIHGHISSIENVHPEFLKEYLRFFPSKTIKHFAAFPLFFDARSKEKKKLGCFRVINRTDEKGNVSKSGFTEENIECLKEIFSKIAMGIAQCLEFKEKEEQLTIKEILDEIPTSPKLDEVMGKIQNSLGEYFDSKVSTVWGYDKQSNKLVLRYLKGLDLKEVPRQILEQNRCVIGEAVAKMEPKHVPDISKETLYAWSDIIDKLGSKRLLAFPFVNTEKQVIGVISLHPPDDFLLTSKDIEIVKTFAEKATYSIEYARLRWREKQLKALVGRLVSLETDKMNFFFENVVEVVQMVTGARACSLFTVDHSKRTVRLEATTDTNQRNRVGEDIYAFNDGGITVRVARKGKTMMSYDISQEKGRPMKFLEEASGPHKAFVAVPIKDRSNKTIAVLRCINKKKTEMSPTEYFTPDDIELLTLIATLILKFIESAEMVKMRHEYTQALTHEILAPATGIMAHAELLMKILDKPMIPIEKKRLKLQDILDECDFLTRLVKGPRILDETASEYRLENVDICYDVLIPRINHLRNFAAPEGISINYVGFERLLFRLDRNKFDEVVFNLIHNAIKYSDKFKTIEIRFHEKKDEYQITIENHGIGVKEGEEEKIFDAYYRTEEAKSKHPTGKGLGLHIVEDICKKLGLEIKLTQRENPTIFTLILPKHLLTRRR